MGSETPVTLEDLTREFGWTSSALGALTLLGAGGPVITNGFFLIPASEENLLSLLRIAGETHMAIDVLREWEQMAAPSIKSRQHFPTYRASRSGPSHPHRCQETKDASTKELIIASETFRKAGMESASKIVARLPENLDHGFASWFELLEYLRSLDQPFIDNPALDVSLSRTDFTPEALSSFLASRFQVAEEPLRRVLAAIPPTEWSQMAQQPSVGAFAVVAHKFNSSGCTPGVGGWIVRRQFRQALAAASFASGTDNLKQTLQHEARPLRSRVMILKQLTQVLAGERPPVQVSQIQDDLDGLELLKANGIVTVRSDRVLLNSQYTSDRLEPEIQETENAIARLLLKALQARPSFEALPLPPSRPDQSQVEKEKAKPIVLPPQPASVSMPVEVHGLAEVVREASIKWVGCCLGVDEASGKKVLLLLDSDRPPHWNTGIMGEMGIGKTQLVRSMIYQALAHSDKNPEKEPVSVIVFDPKGDISEAVDRGELEAEVLHPSALAWNYFTLPPDGGNKDVRIQHLKKQIADFVTFLASFAATPAPKVQEKARTAVVEWFESEGIHTESPEYWPQSIPPFGQLLGHLQKQEELEDTAIRSVVGRMIFVSAFSKTESRPVYDRKSPLRILNLSSFADASGKPSPETRFILEVALTAVGREMLLLPDAKLVKEGEHAFRQVRQIIVIDEAGDIIKHAPGPLTTIMHKGRSKGFGVWLSTQLLGHFASNEEVRHYVGSWVIHKTEDVGPTDLKSILGLASKDADELHRRILGLEKNQSVVVSMSNMKSGAYAVIENLPHFWFYDKQNTDKQALARKLSELQ